MVFVVYVAPRGIPFIVLFRHYSPLHEVSPSREVHAYARVYIRRQPVPLGSGGLLLLPVAEMAMGRFPGSVRGCCSHLSWRPGHADYQAHGCFSHLSRQTGHADCQAQAGCLGHAGSGRDVGVATLLGLAVAVGLGLAAVQLDPCAGMATAPSQAYCCPQNCG